MILILNAPAGAGKDTIGKLLKEKHGVDLRCFKQPMFDIAKACLGEENFSVFMEKYDNRLTKELPLDMLGGMSPREFFIHISENWCKPIFGDEFFGERFAADLPIDNTVVVTDGGFSREVMPMIARNHPVVIVRLFRSGYGFEGDSRSYLKEEDFQHLPTFRRPRFLNVELLENEPQAAADYIADKVL